MTPITESIRYTIELSNANVVSLSTRTISDTYVTTGTIFVNPLALFAMDPILFVASFLVFMIVGAASQKPTMYMIVWLGCLVAGIFQWSNWGLMVGTVVMVSVSGLIIYRFLGSTTGRAD